MLLYGSVIVFPGEINWRGKDPPVHGRHLSIAALM